MSLNFKMLGKSLAEFMMSNAKDIFIISIFSVLIIAIVGHILIGSKTAPKAEYSTIQATAPTETVPGLLADVNKYRATKGLEPLTLNGKLNTSSQAKANDLVTKNYWSHTTPEGMEFSAFITEAGYSYKKAGENLARCFPSTDVIVQAWIDSPAHERVLTGEYQDIGFAVAHNEKNNCNYAVAHFGRAD